MTHSFNEHGCTQELACPAPQAAHTRICPWHPDNVTTHVLSVPDFDALMHDLDSPPRSRLNADQQRDTAQLVRLTREAPVSSHGRAIALFLKYPTPVWLRILEEVTRLTTESNPNDN